MMPCSHCLLVNMLEYVETGKQDIINRSIERQRTFLHFDSIFEQSSLCTLPLNGNMLKLSRLNKSLKHCDLYLYFLYES